MSNSTDREEKDSGPKLTRSWTLGETTECGRIYSTDLYCFGEDRPVFSWTWTHEDVLYAKPGELAYHVPERVTQKYKVNESEITKAISVRQLETKRTILNEERSRADDQPQSPPVIIRKVEELSKGSGKSDGPPKALKALEEYVEDLRVRIVGAQVPAEAYVSLDVLYEDLVRFYQTTLRLDPLTAYLFASYTLLTHQTPNLDFIFQLYITGLKGSGKSTGGERLEAVCYQGFKTGSATFPFLVRANELLNGMTQVLDEFDLIAGDDRVTKYLRGSSDRRNPYGVVEPVTIGGQTHNMPTVKMSFGGRILITSQALKDEMVRDRAVEVVMMQYAGLLPEPSAEEIEKLRGQLAYYREQVKLKVTVEDKQKWYDPKHNTGRLNEIACLLYKVTPEKHNDKIAAIIQREWETRTALERESYTAKVVEALTAAVIADDTKEAPTGETFVPVQEIKAHYDRLYADAQTGKGKTSRTSIGRTMQNLGLHTEQYRVKDEEQRLRGWLLDKTALARVRQSLYLDEAPDLVSDVSDVTALRAPPSLDTYQVEQRERPVHTRTSETTETTETKERTHTS
ncbi:MAG: hypothetical protein ABSA81_01485 [Candidatus Bathyarchaeia archaeon]|jgi:hypothetical protein